MKDFSLKEIQQIKSSDEILSFNQLTNPYKSTKVIALEKHTGNFKLIELNHSSYTNPTASISDKIIKKNIPITATPNHPILTKPGI